MNDHEWMMQKSRDAKEREAMWEAILNAWQEPPPPPCECEAGFNLIEIPPTADDFLTRYIAICQKCKRQYPLVALGAGA